VGRHHYGVEPAEDLAQGGDLLNLATHSHATPAEDALLRVAQDRGAGQVLLVTLPVSLEETLADAHRIGEPLQLAVAVPLAAIAVRRVIVKQQLHDVAPEPEHLRGVRVHYHPVRDGKAARRRQAAHALDLDNTHPTCPCDGQFRVVAEPRDTQADLIRRLHDSGVFRHRYFDAVDR